MDDATEPQLSLGYYIYQNLRTVSTLSKQSSGQSARHFYEKYLNESFLIVMIV